MSYSLCAALGCVAAVEPDDPLCRRHWAMLPADLRPGVLFAHRLPGAHLAAMRRAVTAIAESEGTMTPAQIRASYTLAARLEALDHAPGETPHDRR